MLVVEMDMGVPESKAVDNPPLRACANRQFGLQSKAAAGIRQRADYDHWRTGYSPVSTVTAITTGAVLSGPLTSSMVSIVSFFCGYTAR